MKGRSVHSWFLSACGIAGLLVVSAPAAAQLASVRAPFDHKAHKTVTCKLCHEKEDGQGELRIFTALDCNGCHHSASNLKRCTTCHAGGELKPFARDVEVKTSVAKVSSKKTLTFAHAQHGKLACTSCHGSKAQMQAAPSCASCHDDHHSVVRNCTSCHSNVKSIPSHTREAHITCSGAGCHKTTITAATRTPRHLCLTCHTDKLNHESGGECATCHLFKKNEVRAAP